MTDLKPQQLAQLTTAPDNNDILSIETAIATTPVSKWLSWDNLKRWIFGGVAAGKTLTLTAADNYNLTVPASGTAMLLEQDNHLIRTTLITPETLMSEVSLEYHVSGTTDVITEQGTRSLRVDTYLTGIKNMGTMASVYAVAYNDSTAGSIVHLIGALGTVDNRSTGNVSSAYALYGRVDNHGAGVITDAMGLFINTPHGTGPITNYHGIYSAVAGGGSDPAITNAYSVHLYVPTGATNNNIGLLIGAAPTGPLSGYAAWMNGDVEIVGSGLITGAWSIQGEAALSGTTYITCDLQTTHGIQIINKTSTNWLPFATINSAGTENVYDLTNLGALHWLNGGVTSSGNLLIGTATDGMTTSGSLAISKDLAHRGSLAGFYNHAPAAQPTKAGHNNWASLSDVVAGLVAIGIFDTA